MANVHNLARHILNRQSGRAVPDLCVRRRLMYRVDTSQGGKPEVRTEQQKQRVEVILRFPENKTSRWLGFLLRTGYRTRHSSKDHPLCRLCSMPSGQGQSCGHFQQEPRGYRHEL